MSLVHELGDTGELSQLGIAAPPNDVSSMAGGVRGNYVEGYREGVNPALLDPEVAEPFPTDAAVNEALRTVVRATKAQRLPNKADAAADERKKPQERHLRLVALRS